MRKVLALALLALALSLGQPASVSADEPILHSPRPDPVGDPILCQRWSPAATDYRYLLWNDWSPAFYPGIYSPGWGGWWYMYFGHYYSPYYTPHLHEYPYYHYTHPYFNYPLESPLENAAYVVRKPASAKVVVTLPGDAKLTVNGQLTELTSDQRIFTTPELQPGKDYYYVLKAEVVRDGETKSITKEVAVKAGRESKVEFDLPGASTARK